MLSIVSWFLWLQLLSLPSVVLAWRLFPNLSDRGYPLSKALSILLLFYPLWLGASLRLFPNTTFWALVLLGGLYGVAAVAVGHRRHPFLSFLSSHWKLIALTELLFLGAFLAWCLVRAYNPDISGTEKPVDFSFLNASLRTRFFPPESPGLSGHPVNYYYLGFGMMGMLVKLSGVTPGVGYNLALATIFALAALGAFSLVFNLVSGEGGGWRRAAGFGLLAAGFLLLMANLQGALEFLSSRGWGGAGFWGGVGITGLEQPHPSSTWHPTDHAWWWRASRVIATTEGGKALDYTINEFPFFSFLVGDLHPHIMALPFNLLALGLGLNLFLSRQGSALSWVKGNPGSFLALPLVLGAQGGINSWDLPTFFTLLSAACLWRWGWRRDTLLLAGSVLPLAILLYLPFYANFHSPVRFILPYLGPGSQPLHFFVVWGVWVVALLPFLIGEARRMGWRWWLMGLGVALTPLILGLAARLGANFLLAGDLRLTSQLPLLLSLSLLVAMAVGMGFLLLLGADLFFVLDSFANRMNTVFKLYYQAWLFLSLGAAFALFWLSRGRWGWGKKLWAGGMALLLLTSLYYPAAALTSITGGFSHPPTLDGLAYLSRQNPAEREALEWLRRLPGSPVVVEAVGESFSYYGRVSHFTGLPTLLSWPGHQLQHYGSAKPLLGREEAVERIYTSQDRAQVERLLAQYRVSYVYFGPLEEVRYGPQARERLRGWLKGVFDNGKVAVFQVP